jgi:hypothetical protein
MMKSDTVELFEGICDLSTGSSETRIQRNTLHLASTRTPNVHASAVFDIAEVNGINSTPLVRDHRRFHVTDKSPLRLSEERVGFDVRCTSSGTETPCLVLDEQLADQRFTKTVES